MPPIDTLHRAFGVALRRARRQAGLSQEKLAQASNLTRNYVSQLELGEKSPSLRTLDRLARALRLAPDELLRRATEGEP